MYLKMEIMLKCTMYIQFHFLTKLHVHVHVTCSSSVSPLLHPPPPPPMHKGDYVMCMGKGTCIVKKVSLVFFVFLRHQPNI